MGNANPFPVRMTDETGPETGHCTIYRFHYEDGSFVDVCKELHELWRVKVDTTGGGKFYDDVW